MSEKSVSSHSGGLGFCGALFLVFLTLKLTGIGVVAGWSWWWVTGPLWVPVVAVVGGFFVFIAVMWLAGALSKRVRL